MSYSLWTSAVAAGMWIGAAGPVAAATVVVPSSITFVATGTIAMGVDPANLFGGGDLSGLPYVATYTFQIPPSRTPPYYCCVLNSSGPFGVSSELEPTSLSVDNVSAMITINGDTFALSGYGNAVNAAFIAFGGAPSLDERSVDVQGVSAYWATGVNRTPSVWLGVPGATEIFQNSTVSGVAGGSVANEFVATNGTYAFLDVSSISSTYTTTGVFVPEQSTWAMLLLGFGGLGFLGYRVSQTKAAA